MLTPADDTHHINKHNFKIPFVCGCRDLGEALRRIAEGAAMIRTKGAPRLAPARRCCLQSAGLLEQALCAALCVGIQQTSCNVSWRSAERDD